jgi:hypothetical protein
MYFTRDYLINKFGQNIYGEIQKYLSSDADLPIFKAKFLINSVRALASDFSYIMIESFIPKKRVLPSTSRMPEYKKFYINIFDNVIEKQFTDAIIKYYHSVELEELLCNKLPEMRYETKVELENLFLDLPSYSFLKVSLNDELPTLDAINYLSRSEEIKHTFRTLITLLEDRIQNLPNKIIDLYPCLFYNLKSYYTAFDRAIDSIAQENLLKSLELAQLENVETIARIELERQKSEQYITTCIDETHNNLSSSTFNNCSLKAQVSSINEEVTENVATSSSSLMPIAPYNVLSKANNLSITHEEESEYSCDSSIHLTTDDQANLGLVSEN